MPPDPVDELIEAAVQAHEALSEAGHTDACGVNKMSDCDCGYLALYKAEESLMRALTRVDAAKAVREAEKDVVYLAVELEKSCDMQLGSIEPWERLDELKKAARWLLAARDGKAKP